MQPPGQVETWDQTVLVVDDDRSNRAALGTILQDSCRVILAKSGRAALDILAREEVSLVLLDVSMPEMDGYEVLQRMRADPRTEGIGIIFITGMTDTADEERGLLLGASDYVQKPIRPAIVRARVNIHLKLARQRRDLELLSQRDALTGIANRRYFDEAFSRNLAQAARAGQPLGVAIMDVDHFKQYNDHYGHGAGDEALRAVASVLSGFARRPGDVAARYGGEEFVLLLPQATNLEDVLNRVRLGLIGRAIPHVRSLTAEVLTFSCGGVVCYPDSSHSPKGLLEHADTLLYQAKQQGRNRVRVEMLG